MRLFVDCDDTLIIWLGEDGQPLEGQNPYGGGSEKWKWNEELLLALEWFDADVPIFLWSGGGSEYATDWARRLSLRGFDVEGEGLDKDPRIPISTDLCIDDHMPFNVACPVQTWQEFVEEHGASA